MKKSLISSLLLIILAAGFLFSSDKDSFDLSAMEIAKKMELGWNLSNSLDANSFYLAKDFPYNEGLKSETEWGELLTTKEIIQSGIDNGYKTIRIPVTWYNHIIDSNYTIDPAWMNRVKQLVDWAIEAGYYVILNEHHSVHAKMNAPLKHCEGYIIRNTPEDIKESRAFLTAVWEQICTHFNNDYDQHLIFETMNEPNNRDHEHAWYPEFCFDCQECLDDIELVNQYNQMILDVIRKSGGNNSRRFVMIPASGAGVMAALDKRFVLPRDSAEGKLFVTVHTYPLGLEEGEGTESKKFTDEIKNVITYNITQLNQVFCSKGIPVVIGEYGTPKTNPYGGAATYKDRLLCYKHICALAGKYSMPLINWESGGAKAMATIDRNTGKAFEPEYLAAGLKAWKKK